MKVTMRVKKKSVEYRQTESIIKVIIRGERLWLVRGLMFQKKM